LLALQATAHLRQGEVESAGTLLEEARRLVGETGERWYEPEIVRLSGEALAAMGCRAEAELELHHALRLAERQGTRLWRQRTLASLERFWRGRQQHGCTGAPRSESMTG
jgi:hypothetical protein